MASRSGPGRPCFFHAGPDQFQNPLVEGQGDADRKQGYQDFGQIALVQGDADAVADAGIGGNELGHNGAGHGQGGAAGHHRGQLVQVFEGPDFTSKLPAQPPGHPVKMLDIGTGSLMMPMTDNSRGK
jgi:hypothetical protein